MTQKQDDHEAVDLLAAAMKRKLDYKRSERGGGYSGWEDLEVEDLWERLAAHIVKRDPVDVANFAAMIYANSRSKP